MIAPITTSTANVTLIPAQPRLDPIRVIWLDQDPGKAYVIIHCYDQSWCACWNAMGKGRTAQQFFLDCDAHYLHGAFVAGKRITKSDQAYLLRVIEAVLTALREQVPA